MTRGVTWRGPFAALARDRRGNTAVEFAIIAPVLLAMIFATLDYGRLLFWESNLRYAVQQGARCATLGSSPSYCCADTAAYTCGGGNTPADYAATKAAVIGATASNFTLTSATCGQQMKVTGVTFYFIVPTLPGLDLSGGHAGKLTLAPLACYP